MRHAPPSRGAGPQHGFILVTSLVFLVILTLLAVSAITASTLQDRMAGNQREKSQALQAANSALAAVAAVLNQPLFLACQRLLNGNLSPPSDCPSAITRLPIRADAQALTSPDVFLSDAFWQAGPSAYYQPEGANGAGAQYVVELLRTSRTNLASQRTSTLLFRVTARATGRQRATATTQMIYEISQ